MSQSQRKIVFIGTSNDQRTKKLIVELHAQKVLTRAFRTTSAALVNAASRAAPGELGVIVLDSRSIDTSAENLLAALRASGCTAPVYLYWSSTAPGGNVQVAGFERCWAADCQTKDLARAILDVLAVASKAEPQTKAA